MIVEFATEEELHKRLLEGYVDELESYCKAKGFSEEQTKVFIKNTLEAEEKSLLTEIE